MVLKQIQLSHFRNYTDKKFDFSPAATVIVGPNAIGKTNILEAIALLSTGRSFRADLEREMIREGEEIGRVQAMIKGSKDQVIKRSQEQYEQTKLEVVLTTGSVLGKSAPYKRFLINSIGKQFATFIGVLPTVLFWPEDLRLVIGSPSTRRRFLDTVLSQTDHDYRRSLMAYEKAIRIRNKLLQQEKDGMRIPLDQYAYWDDVLIQNGTVLTKKREELLSFINTITFPHSAGCSFEVTYDNSTISVARLEKYFMQERAAGVTLVGPHRDDFIIFKLMKGDGGQMKADLNRFGSRGEQRLGVLWLKLAELAYMERSIGVRPLLLLDDIFSELDEEHRDLVMDLVGKQQTIITTTDDEIVMSKKHDEMQLISLKSG